MAEHNDPGRARRLTLLRQVEGELAELFSHANGLPEPKRTEARTFLRDLFTRAAGARAGAGAARAQVAPTSGPRRAEPRLVVTGPANPDGAKGPRCDRCGGSGTWKGSKGGSGPCLGCNGSGVQRQRARGARYGSR